jgi:hypothetical protein
MCDRFVLISALSVHGKFITAVSADGDAKLHRLPLGIPAGIRGKMKNMRSSGSCGLECSSLVPVPANCNGSVRDKPSSIHPF